STDSAKLNTILSILIGNAIKFTKAGSIEFGCNMVETHGPRNIGAGRASLQFYVKDTGIGIFENKQQSIFELFMQADVSNSRQFEGAGLGLSIAKAYVEMLGGKIWVESDPEDISEGKGSTFFFTLPYNNERLKKMGTNEDVSEVSGLKILIVEDDETSELFLRNAIKLFSKEILYARTGVKAVEGCRNNPDIDLILMDIKMPVMDGLEATRQIRQFNKEVIIIAQTAFGLTDDQKKAIAAGCNDYISKPIKKEQLLVLIQKYFL
ncbi:MAG TPA: response regulator, partial [Prolixibacteraceae bacterium]